MATPHHSLTPAPPTPAPKGYVVTERLGSGSYGDVFKAYKKSRFREVVAIKCVLISKLSKPEKDNLIQEIALMKELKHDYIVTLVDFIWDSTYIYIVMEYCGGGDLSRFVKSRKALAEAVCKKFLQQVAAAMKYLHSKDIAHMDLKPQNILLSNGKNPVVKLCDFGFATYFAPDQTRTSLRGSPLYMAPEMVLDHKYDASVDLWSIGVILFECLFGKAPYKSASTDELLLKIKEDRPIVIPRCTTVSESCRDLLQRCLNRNPAERISFEDFFNHPFLDLEHFPSDESYAKAIGIADQAVTKDKEGAKEEALTLYKSALEYLVPLAQGDHQSAARGGDSLRKQTAHFIQRAEQLKSELNPSHAAATEPTMERRSVAQRLQKRSTLERSKYEELFNLCASNSKLQTGLEIAKAAEEYELEANYKVAQDKYKTALGILIPLLSEEPAGGRKTLLHAEVKRWLTRAECVKELLSIQDRVIAQNSALDVPDGGKQCSLQ